MAKSDKKAKTEKPEIKKAKPAGIKRRGTIRGGHAHSVKKFGRSAWHSMSEKDRSLISTVSHNRGHLRVVGALDREEKSRAFLLRAFLLAQAAVRVVPAEEVS